ncbi:hypothetical protein FNV43_RR21920 [Rhamnella rubrinervis]|uniref:F-box domain-containing protein n=1 Tax=Rhamnella rubrinervis TaxID=2594499 RepID=A0A8K0GS18_9ROSA|nr:hypothetical protein FNV43_RR21920 [Rhamnella rubrinervis]
MASTKRPKSSESAAAASGNETPSSSSSSSSPSPTLSVDLLMEILVCLPVRSLIRFKSVSKQWLALISDPHFCSRRTSQTPPFHSPASGLVLLRPGIPSSSPTKNYECVNLCKLSCPSFRNLSSTLDSSCTYEILQPCNGLFLLVSFINTYSRSNYCVYNPTTKACTVLPLPPPVPSGTKLFLADYNLALDPAKSPHYRVVCFRRSNREDSFNHPEIQIYESETASWRLSDCGFSPGTFVSNRILFLGRIFWNGSIHWLHQSGVLYFNVDEAYVRKTPLPEGSANWMDMELGYFGVSGDHLHLVGVCIHSWPKFNVYEMKRDYSGWFVKFRVDLAELLIQFPEIQWNDFPNYACSCSIICVVRGELDDDSYLVLHIPGKIVRYYLKTKTWEVLISSFFPFSRGIVRWSNAHQFIESLACV